jgi:hypothetical protein
VPRQSAKLAKANDPKTVKTNEPLLPPEEAKQQLFDKAKKVGHISQRDIFAAIPETVENAEILDLLYTELAEATLEITTTDPDAAAFTDEWLEEGEEPEAEEPTNTAVYLDDDVARDR